IVAGVHKDHGIVGFDDRPGQSAAQIVGAERLWQPRAGLLLLANLNMVAFCGNLRSNAFDLEYGFEQKGVVLGRGVDLIGGDGLVSEGSRMMRTELAISGERIRDLVPTCGFYCCRSIPARTDAVVSLSIGLAVQFACSSIRKANLLRLRNRVVFKF
ncbi:hypothetical protein AB4043_19925, partial [Terriglobus sp. YAF25]|uniref:hypothetical protein n=1 Tax=Terriglobus sp. YAF25 TaxID=3233080 RepID=UPI003F974673